MDIMSELLLLIILSITIIGLLIIINKNNNTLMNIYMIFIIVISYILSFRNISFIGMNINANIIIYSTIIINQKMIHYIIQKL